jgi:hypothetical protein
MAKVTGSAVLGEGSVGNVTFVEEHCPICGGDDAGCPFGDWSWGDDDIVDAGNATA